MRSTATRIASILTPGPTFWPFGPEKAVGKSRNTNLQRRQAKFTSRKYSGRFRGSNFDGHLRRYLITPAKA